LRCAEPMDSTTSFNTYEQDFKVLAHSIRSQLDGDASEAQTGEMWRCVSLSSKSNASLSSAEQRKATSRRVEMELEEADEMVSVLTSVGFPSRLPWSAFCRSPKWKSRSKPSPIHKELNTNPVYGTRNLISRGTRSSRKTCTLNYPALHSSPRLPLLRLTSPTHPRAIAHACWQERRSLKMAPGVCKIHTESHWRRRTKAQIF
jgi:hypothetical protein